MINTKQINSIMSVIGTAITTFEIMMKTFKWYENKHKKKKEDYSRPIIKGA
jgi:hypothetical protein